MPVNYPALTQPPGPVLLRRWLFSAALTRSPTNIRCLPRMFNAQEPTINGAGAALRYDISTQAARCGRSNGGESRT